MVDIPANTTTTAGFEGKESFIRSYSGELETFDDRDWIRINLSAGVTYSIFGSMQAAGTFGDAYLELFDTAGTLLASDDDGGTGVNSLLTFSATISGTYFVGIKDLSTDPGQYCVSVAENTGTVLQLTSSSDTGANMAGSAWYAAGKGADSLSGYVNVLGEQGDDVLQGISISCMISGGLGNDAINGGLSADYLMGDAGNDFISGGEGSDTIYGGDGNDGLRGGSGGDEMRGGNDSDRLDGGADSDTLYGDAGDDKLDGGTQGDLMRGGLGNDTYLVDDTGDITDEITGGGGTGDYVFATTSYSVAAGIERLYLDGSGNINATGRAVQNDILIGNVGNNTLNGLSGNDVMRGGLGNDTYLVDAAGDTTDEVTGGGGLADYVYASVNFTAAQGIERLYLTGAAISGTGRDGQNDIITGNASANTLTGLSGNDVLIGGLGNDTLNGGLGQDIFRFDTAPNSTTNRDTIIGFVAADDTIQLDDAFYVAQAIIGPLLPAAFNTGTAATQADDRIIYNTATGVLIYDSDGTGAAVAQQFAVLSGAPAITVADFVLF